jgi:hypothetical protein
MPHVGFEPIIIVFERAKTAHALDRTATVIGFCSPAYMNSLEEVVIHKYKHNLSAGLGPLCHTSVLLVTVIHHLYSFLCLFFPL